jgi:hypothetical protein
LFAWPAFGICVDSSFFVSVPLRGLFAAVSRDVPDAPAWSRDAADLAASADAVSGALDAASCALT